MSAPTVYYIAFDKTNLGCVVKRIIVTGSPVTYQPWFHWTIVLDLRTGVLLITSVDYMESSSAQPSVPYLTTSLLTVRVVMDFIIKLKRNKYRFDESGTAYRYWCWALLSDFEQAGFIDAGSAKKILEVIADLARNEPERYPIPVR